MKPRLLIADYTAGSSAGPFCASLYASLAERFDISMLCLPVPALTRYMIRLRSLPGRVMGKGLTYWQMMERYSFLPSTYQSTTRRYARAVRSRLNREPVDMIFQFGALFGPIAPRADVPYVTYHDGNMTMTREAPSYQSALQTEDQFRSFIALERKLVLGAARVLTYSKRTRESYITAYGCSPERTVAVGSCNWVRPGDREWLDRLLATDVRTLEADRDPNMVLFPHTNYRLKGGPVLMEAFARVVQQFPKAQLVVAGPSPELAHGPNVRALGVVRDRNELLSLYRRASVVVLPTLNDNFPRVLFEAMVHGLPCIATSVGGIPEQILDGETGYVVPPGDADSLARRICSVLGSSERRCAMGRAGRAHVLSSFLPEAVGSRVAAELDAVLAERRSAC
jgi:glycosyltransferase involved in cell wall biosynthesis